MHEHNMAKTSCRSALDSESASAGLTSGARLHSAVHLRHARQAFVFARRALGTFFWPSAIDIDANEDPESDSGAQVPANFYSVVLYELRCAKGTGAAVRWATAGICLSLLQLLAVYGIAITSVYPSCLYREDCRLGTVCAADVNIAWNGNGTNCVQCTQCFSCEAFYNPTSFIYNSQGLGFTLSPRSTSGWKSDDNITRYCELMLRSPQLSTWPRPPTDFSRCLHVQASLMRLTTFGKMVLTAAFVFIAGSVASERQQQLHNRELRCAWFPAPHRSWRSMCAKVMELLLWPGMLNSVLIALLQLLAATSFSAQDVLLNGLSLSFVLVIDDELVGFVVGAPRRAAIEQAATKAIATVGGHRAHSRGGALLAQENTLKACAAFYVTFGSLVTGMSILANTSCIGGITWLLVVTGGLLGVVGTVVIESAIHAILTQPPDVSRVGCLAALAKSLGVSIGFGLLDGCFGVALCWLIWLASAVLSL